MGSGSKDGSAACPQRRAACTGSCTARLLLLEGLLPAAANFIAGLHFVGSLPLVCHNRADRHVDGVVVRLDFKNARVERDLLARWRPVFLIDFDLHVHLPLAMNQPSLTISRYPLIAPGTEPFTIRRLDSGTTFTTLRLRTVTRENPILPPPFSFLGRQGKDTSGSRWIPVL